MISANPQIIRSSRRSLALQVTREGRLIVRAPRFLSETKITRFVEENSRWIEKKIHQAAERLKTASPTLPAEEEKRFKVLAYEVFFERSHFYAIRMGVQFKKIRLNSAKTRWGSCGPQGNLSYNWRLIQAPPEILDYVVVHELAHLMERNHSPRFWAKVFEFYPNYKSAKQWLKKHEI